ncbi:proprotein convertase subtilisin/kexin type 5-like, partial [Engraulis encrasicolus]|uniref:proprotein convertase subtilisin/kexin type 5-like n=1 Tax=Engraulis encrasicolus TaxID=184585 RepID=UPI002FD71C5B
CLCLWFVGEYQSRHGPCHHCDFSCNTCHGPEVEDCLTCSTLRLYDKGTCVIRCDTGKYGMDGSCHLCHHTCHECSGDGPANCTSCQPDPSGAKRYLVAGECRYSCPEGYFPSPSHSECRPCPSNCHVCASPEHCVHCSPGYYPKDGDCLSLSCGEGAVEDDDHEECVTCEEGCERCLTINRFHCNACYKDYYQHGVACHRHCPDGTYGDNSTLTCMMCDAHCRICDASQCYWCDDDYYLSDDKCVKQCAEGLYGDEERRECESCHHTCRTCSGPAHDDCDSCEDGMTLEKGLCVPVDVTVTCGTNHFLTATGTCMACYSDCGTCSGPFANQCDTCGQGNFLSPDQRCVRRCPAGSFGNESSWRCEECVAGCTQCRDAHSCQRCQTSPAELYLQSGRCVPECQGGYPVAGECEACDAHCVSCEGPGMCEQCDEQYLLHGLSCVEHCPPRYRPLEGTCQRCPNGCSDCHGEYCTGCEKYYFLHQHQCVDDCPRAFYASVLTQKCDACHPDCAACDGPEDDDCIDCSDRRATRYRGKCVRLCPANTYQDKQRGECQDCHETCQTCSGPLPSSCESCSEGMELDATRHCVPAGGATACPHKSYVDASGDCKPCHATCHHCSGGADTQCISCDQGRFLLNGTCIKQCPDGYYGDGDDYVCERWVPLVVPHLSRSRL